MSDRTIPTAREYESGEIVEPGAYIDVQSGALIEVLERDELPEGSRVIHYRRRFRRVEAEPTRARR